MPASSTLVTLDDAKGWAKRLHKHQPDSTLAKSQEAVAAMLGHSCWHALTRFYKAQAPANPAPDPEPKSSSESYDEWLEETLGRINRTYPGLNATQVEVLAHETTEFEASSDELYEKMRHYDWEGYSPDAALEMAFDELAVTVKAPPGHLIMRVRTADDTAYLVTVGTSPHPKPRKAGPR